LQFSHAEQEEGPTSDRYRSPVRHKTLHSLVLSGLILVVAACGSVDTVTPKERDKNSAIRSFRVLKEGSMGQSRGSDEESRTATISVARSELAFAAQWAQYAGNDPLPQVDFTVESVVLLQLGQRSTGGYAIQPQEITERDGTLRVIAPVSSPGKGTIVTMAFTSPYAFVAVRARDFHEAEWVGTDGSPMARQDARNRM